MMRKCLLALCVGGAAAFSPAGIPSLRTSGRATSTLASSRAVVRSAQGARGLRLTAVNAKAEHAPTGMDDWAELGKKPWGSIDADMMYVQEFKEGATEWSAGELRPFGPLQVSPKAGVLNYGQGVFEGMKAQRTEDGRIVVFRPDRNAERTRYGCERLCMPPVPKEQFIKAVEDVVLANAKWVPPYGSGSLYLRPLIIGTGPVLGLNTAPSFTFLIYVSPVGSYFKGNQMSPIALKIEDRFSRAAPGGSGGIKAVGNYAGSLLPQTLAKKGGFDNVIYLDAAEKKYLEEVGTSNIFVRKGDTIYTPALEGGGACEDTILEGVTRSSVIQVAKDAGYKVEETRVPSDMLWDADEAFTVGTAVVVSPIGRVEFQGKTKKWEFEGGAGPATAKIYDTLTGIQTGKVADPYGWTVYLD